MTTYLLLFRNISGEGQYVSTPQDMAEDMPRWQAWIGALAAQGKLVDTKPIAYEGAVVDHDGIRTGPHLAAGHLVAGYLICQAESLGEIAEHAQSCPILKYPHGSVEIRSVLPFES
ncbi:MAG: YciI family protein [Bacteroidia bacterium]|nr:YciI family protein [Bacteroidia bacterium]